MSERQKLPTEISTEELLELMKQLPEPSAQPKIQTAIAKEEFVSSNIIVSFVMAFHFQPGEYLVHTKVLFKLFKNWSNSDISIREFTINLNYYIPSKYTNGKTFFCLNFDGLTIANIIDKRQFKTRHQGLPVHSVKRFKKWIAETKLQKGDIYIESDILYFIFDTWCYKKKISTPRYTNFVIYLKRVFNHVRLRNEGMTWLGVNEEIYNCITEDAVKNWRYYREKKNKGIGMPRTNKRINVAFSEVRYEVQRVVKEELKAEEERKLNKKKQRKISRFKT